MINIIKEGILPEPQKFKTTCPKCGCIFEATEEEFQYICSNYSDIYTDIKGEFSSVITIHIPHWKRRIIDCPFCQKEITYSYTDEERLDDFRKKYNRAFKGEK